jgi:hypothetical protein
LATGSGHGEMSLHSSRAESVAPQPCPPRALPEGQQRSFTVIRGLLASLQQAARFIGGVTGDLLRRWL